MQIENVVVGPIETNCYILSIDDDVIVIDPGDEYNKIKDVIGNRSVIGVIVTHHHFDHVGALSYFDKKIVYDFNNLDEGIHEIGKFKFEVIYTPGHKSDLISIYFSDIKVLFVGDFIFYESIGRTDLETGNMREMKESILKTKIFDDDVVIYPGHGPSTTFKHERMYNYYFKG